MNETAQHSSLEIRIEELVLHGFAPRDRQRIATAIEFALTRLLVERGLPAVPVQLGPR